MPEIPSSPDKQQATSAVTAAVGVSTDEVNITEISSDDSADCIIVEHHPPKANKSTEEQPKVKRVRFTTPEPSPPTSPSDETPPAPPPPPPPTPSSSSSSDSGNLLTQR